MSNYKNVVISAEVDSVSTLELQYLSVDQPLTHLTAYSLEELLDRTPILQLAKTNPVVIAQIRTALTKWQPVRAQFLKYTQEGSESWIELDLIPVNDEKGCYTHWISVERDISERKQTQILLKQQTERERLLSVMAQRIRQSLNLEQILNTTVTQVREFLLSDRVFIYRFEPDWSGVVVVESVAEDWSSILGRRIKDSYFVETAGRRLYEQGRIQATEDVYTAGLSQCHIELLIQLQVRANLVVPILQAEKLWGLLVANQCSGERQWQQLEIDLLKQLATQVAIAIQQSELYQQLQVANQQLQRLAALDGLTQVANRRRFDECLNQEWQRMAREQTPLALILCDIDFFKVYNDTYGHQAGDECLQQVAQVLSNIVQRPADLVARYGGEEFAIILPNTKAENALLVAERIRTEVQALQGSQCKFALRQQVTLSLGVAGIVPNNELVPTILIASADDALYQAKEQGRNCVVLGQLDPIRF